MRGVLRAKPGEESAVGLAFIYFFMLLCAYYLLRPVRDAMAISAGLENLRWLYTGTFVSMMVLSPLFGVLVSRVRKQFLLPITNLFFASNLLVYYLLFKVMPDAFGVAASFFVWLSVFNMFAVSVFWSFMADVFRDEEAKRLFGAIAAGGGTGSIVGSFVTQDIVPALGVVALAPPVRIHVEFKLPLFLPSTARLEHWPRDGRHVFVLKDGEGQRPHLAGSTRPG